MLMDKHLKILSMLGLVSFVAAAGTVQADEKKRDEWPAAATKHQTEALTLNNPEQSEPRFQFGRRGNDFVAMMPVTQHQSEVLNLQKAEIGYKHPEDFDAGV